jgi:hypothetical protein
MLLDGAHPIAPVGKLASTNGPIPMKSRCEAV